MTPVPYRLKVANKILQHLDTLRIHQSALVSLGFPAKVTVAIKRRKRHEDLPNLPDLVIQIFKKQLKHLESAVDRVSVGSAIKITSQTRGQAPLLQSCYLMSYVDHVNKNILF